MPTDKATLVWYSGIVTDPWFRYLRATGFSWIISQRLKFAYKTTVVANAQSSLRKLLIPISLVVWKQGQHISVMSLTACYSISPPVLHYHYTYFHPYGWPHKSAWSLHNLQYPRSHHCLVFSLVSLELGVSHFNTKYHKAASIGVNVDCHTEWDYDLQATKFHNQRQAMRQIAVTTNTKPHLLLFTNHIQFNNVQYGPSWCCGENSQHREHKPQTRRKHEDSLHIWDHVVSDRFLKVTGWGRIETAHTTELPLIVSGGVPVMRALPHPWEK